MSEIHPGPIYLARERFSKETEAETRRKEASGSSRLVTDWCVAKLREVIPEGRVLDLACGNGRHLSELAGPTIRVFAGDYSRPMLYQARASEVGAPPVCFEAEALPFASHSIEGIFSARFFHHLPTLEIRAQILAEMFRAAKLAVAITYKSQLSAEHLRHIAKCAVRKNQPSRFFNRLEEFHSIARMNGWSITEVFNPGSPLSANRGVLFEPK